MDASFAENYNGFSYAVANLQIEYIIWLYMYVILQEKDQKGFNHSQIELVSQTKLFGANSMQIGQKQESY